MLVLNLPSEVLWVVAFPIWVLVSTVLGHVLVVNAILIRANEDEWRGQTDGRHFYALTLLSQLAYLAAFLAFSGYAFDVTVPALGAIGLPAGFVAYATETRLRRAFTSADGRGSRSLEYGVYLLPVLPIAVIEELFLRGVLFELYVVRGPVWFVTVSSALFAILHATYGVRAVVAKAAAGAIYALAMIATGTVAVPILLHVGYNLNFLLSSTGVLDR